MYSGRLRLAIGVFVLAAFAQLIAYQNSAPTHQTLAEPFSAGWMVTDTNGDGIADFIAGKVVVPASPTAEQNAAAADVAARLGYATTGFTPPVVIAASQDDSSGPRIYIGTSEASQH